MTKQSGTLPAIRQKSDLARYLDEIARFPLLAREEEFKLAKSWRDHGDRAAAETLVTSHLRLAASIAMGYRGYGLPEEDLIAEGNRGLMQAVQRFDPDKGFRLSTYARWWIDASIREFVLRFWSIVKIGTTAAQKKLFYGLNRSRKKIGALEKGDLKPENVTAISKDLDVPERDVIAMARRMTGTDQSLHAPVSASDEDAPEWMEMINDETPDIADRLADEDEHVWRKQALAKALDTLNERERDILQKRQLVDKTLTLEQLAGVYKVSKERIRQIEKRAFEKVQERMVELQNS